MTAPTPADLLAAYDDQLRTEAELTGAERVTRVGPVLLARFAPGRGFVTYRDLGGLDAPGVERLVDQVVERLRGDPVISEAEWKTRGHDDAPGLHHALSAAGFVPEEPESVMIGELAGLADAPAPPPEVALRRVTGPDDVRAMVRMQQHVFGDVGDSVEGMVGELLSRSDDPDLELWVAEVAGTVVWAGRLEAVPGTDVAGIWGGVTRPEWRGRGLYRALTAARARSALARGKRWVHSDSTPMSRPILERSGLVAVTTTTPYRWRREG